MPVQQLRKVKGTGGGGGGWGVGDVLASPGEGRRNNYGPSPWPCADLKCLIPSNAWVMKFNSLILVVEGG